MKSFNQFIQEGRSKEQQYKGAYETLQQKYNKEYQDLKDVKPYKPTQGINVKTAQIVNPGKSSQLKFPSTPTGINIRLTNTENEMKGVKSQAELIKKLGFRSLKDIDDRNP